MISTIHPFPARMAPELALESLRDLEPGAVVFDPMTGSGTVLRHAAELGHSAKGRDLDPLAVLMANVWTKPVDSKVVTTLFEQLTAKALSLNYADIKLPWIDHSEEARNFVRYWFGLKQRKALRRLASVIADYENTLRSPSSRNALDVIKIALSRIIVTKEQCASLARDTSHSRPHKVCDNSNYDVFNGLRASLKLVLARLEKHPVPAGAKVHIINGDARKTGLRRNSVDLVLTSPPYLNAIDYMRGHRMSLIWLGYTLESLRSARGNAIGTERGLDCDGGERVARLKSKAGELSLLPRRYQNMVTRYVIDVDGFVSESNRVLRPGGRATFVVGDSCLRGVYVRNSEIVASAAIENGLRLVRRYERKLPTRSRYLPTSGSALEKRMRAETILCFEKPA